MSLFAGTQAHHWLHASISAHDVSPGPPRRYLSIRIRTCVVIYKYLMNPSIRECLKNSLSRIGIGNKICRDEGLPRACGTPAALCSMRMCTRLCR